MTDERRDLAAAEALGTLDAPDSAQLSAEVERDPTLGAELDDFGATVSMLEASVAREGPTHDLFAGILAEIEPQPASTMSGSLASVLAHSQVLAPRSTCSPASSAVSHCGIGCLEAITRLIVRVDCSTRSNVASSVLASGGR